MAGSILSGRAGYPRSREDHGAVSGAFCNRATALGLALLDQASQFFRCAGNPEHNDSPSPVALYIRYLVRLSAFPGKPARRRSETSERRLPAATAHREPSEPGVKAVLQQID